MPLNLQSDYHYPKLTKCLIQIYGMETGWLLMSDRDEFQTWLCHDSAMNPGKSLPALSFISKQRQFLWSTITVHGT